MANIVRGNDTDEVFNEKDGISGDVDWVFAGGGNDWAYGLGGDDALYGENGDDHLFGGADDDLLQGGAGFDELDGGDGNHDRASYNLSLGAVAVTLTNTIGYGFGGAAEGDTLVRIEDLQGSTYDDYLVGNDADNNLDGHHGNDILKGGGGTNVLFGAGGNDTLKGGGGTDILNGGDNVDTVTYYSSPVGVLVSLREHYAYNGDAAGDTLINIENLTGSAYSDSLSGDDYANVLIGMGENDTLHGHGDNDTLIGDDGNDWLVGDAGADTMIGGMGNDVYFVDDLGDRITEHGGEGLDRVRVAISWWSLPEGADVESLEAIYPMETTDLVLVGNSSGNVVIGNDGDNYLFGAGGVDEMRGRAGDDTYWVENTADTVVEASGLGIDEVRTSVSWTITGTADIETLRTTNDYGTGAIDLTGNLNGNTVVGNDGSNTINGRDGDDELTGRGGEDLFWFDTALDDNPMPDDYTNIDTIMDFNVADDTIVLDRDLGRGIFASLAPGSLAPGAFVIGTAALDGDDRIVYNNVTGALSYDSDGLGGTGAVQFATLNMAPTLTYLDFLVVA
jgi:Ca2+-binding RTX toxin-like protein